MLLAHTHATTAPQVYEVGVPQALVPEIQLHVLQLQAQHAC